MLIFEARFNEWTINAGICAHTLLVKDENGEQMPIIFPDNMSIKDGEFILKITRQMKFENTI
jgi:hypothetical protein